MQYIQVCLVLIVASAYFLAVDACDGYKLKLKLEEDDPNNFIKFNDIDVQLTKDCFVVPKGCMKIEKEMGRCQVMYDIRKKGIVVPFKGEKNMCEEIEKMGKTPEAVEKLKEYNVVAKCPIPKMDSMCVPEESKMNVEQYKDKFRLAAGIYTGTVTVKCDCGTSAFKVSAEFKRGK
ncbi:hypothetical protein L9F63_021723 [Diploptera punctata]|uniref:Uncharacterized protein n=1 Tax=Diploptera punctata TaxID=6984 RepID=A0AAD8EBN4_DIPPU|nr:hypothetical protein L9F63_021723 [Diploptera punctata]